MSRSERSSRRQSPSLGAPTPPESPLAALPFSRSFELKWTVPPAARASVTGPSRRPPSSTAWMAASPACPERLATRTKPCRSGSDALGNSGTKRRCPPSAVVDAPTAGCAQVGECGVSLPGAPPEAGARLPLSCPSRPPAEASARRERAGRRKGGEGAQVVAAPLPAAPEDRAGKRRARLRCRRRPPPGADSGVGGGRPHPQQPTRVLPAGLLKALRLPPLLRLAPLRRQVGPAPRIRRRAESRRGQQRRAQNCSPSRHVPRLDRPLPSTFNPRAGYPFSCRRRRKRPASPPMALSSGRHLLILELGMVLVRDGVLTRQAPPRYPAGQSAP